MTPCMGGWCARRDQCPHYTAEGIPVERLCLRGFDGMIWDRDVTFMESKNKLETGNRRVRGVKLYCAMAKALVDAGGMTANQLAVLLNIDLTNVGNVLSTMRAYGVAHIDRWDRTSAKSRRSPVWKFGYGVDAEKPTSMYKPAKTLDAVAISAFCEVYRQFEEPATTTEAALAIGRTPEVFAGHVRMLKSFGLLHISGWKRSKKAGRWVPLYSIGSGTDAKRPRGYTAHEIKMKARKRAAEYAMLKIRQRVVTEWDKPVPTRAANSVFGLAA